jgi:hypothetical protein
MRPWDRCVVWMWEALSYGTRGWISANPTAAHVGGGGGGGGGTDTGTLEFELHVPNWPSNHVCDTGCVPGTGVGIGWKSLVLWYQRVDLCQSHRSTHGGGAEHWNGRI